MFALKKILALPMLWIAISMYSCGPKVPDQNWQKGNLHTHSFWSDGDGFPEMIIQWYKDHDYQFIALSDHNTIASGEFWYELKSRDIENKALEKYQKRFGSWVESKKEAGKTLVRVKPFEEYKAKLEDPGLFSIIRSEEVTSSFENKPVHINVTNIQQKIDPFRAQSVLEIMQKTIDAVLEQRNRLNIPMFAHINHPNFGYGISTEDMKNLNGERFFELYNGHPAVNNSGNEDHIAIELMWDLINIHYYQEGKPLLLGIATDDSHSYHQQSPKLSNTGRGWVMVNSKSLLASDLISAMEKGDFYASSGVQLKKVLHDQEKLYIEVDPEEGGEYEIIFMGYQKETDQVMELKRVKGTKGVYQFQEEDIFVRANIHSNLIMEPLSTEPEMQKAWTQPLIVN